jgi:hypothetical protein
MISLRDFSCPSPPRSRRRWVILLGRLGVAPGMTLRPPARVALAASRLERADRLRLSAAGAPLRRRVAGDVLVTNVILTNVIVTNVILVFVMVASWIA